MSKADPQTTNGGKILVGLEEALRHARGEPTEVRVTTYLVPRRARATVRPDGIVEISRKPTKVRNGR